MDEPQRLAFLIRRGVEVVQRLGHRTGDVEAEGLGHPPVFPQHTEADDCPQGAAIHMLLEGERLVPRRVQSWTLGGCRCLEAGRTVLSKSSGG